MPDLKWSNDGGAVFHGVELFYVAIKGDEQSAVERAEGLVEVMNRVTELKALAESAGILDDPVAFVETLMRAKGWADDAAADADRFSGVVDPGSLARYRKARELASLEGIPFREALQRLVQQPREDNAADAEGDMA